VFAAAADILDPIFRASPLAISLEVSEIDPVGARRQSNLHARMQARETVAV
jgi:5-carboxymethyl-2-hydroxymuconate isomerase